jgi:hypothetical protein
MPVISGRDKTMNDMNDINDESVLQEEIQPEVSPIARAHFKTGVKGFEADANQLVRGFKTALFVQRFKAGLLDLDEPGSRRLQ